MSVNQKITIQLEVYNGENKRVDFENKVYEVVIQDGKFHDEFDLDKSTADKEITFPETALDFLLIWVNGSIKMRINDIANDQIEIKDFYAVSSAGINKIFLTNESADTDVNVKYYLAKKTT